MKEILKEIFPNKWLFLLALLLAIIFSYRGFCNEYTVRFSCMEQGNFYYFNLLGAFFKFIGIYSLLFLGYGIGRHKLREEIKQSFDDKGYVGSTNDKIGNKYNIKISFEHYEAIRRYFFEKIDG